MVRKNRDIQRYVQLVRWDILAGWEGTKSEIGAKYDLEPHQTQNLVNQVKESFAEPPDGRVWAYDYTPPNGKPRFILAVTPEDKKRLIDGGAKHVAAAARELRWPLLGAETSGDISKDEYVKAVTKYEELAVTIVRVAADLKWKKTSFWERFRSRRSRDL